MVDFLMIGTGGGMPMPSRFLSAGLITYKGRKILIDCGEGTQVSMRIANTGFKSIDVICITHVHGDHIVGLPGLLGTIGNSGRTEPLVIIGPEGITKVVNGLRTIAEYLPYEINIIENPEEKIVLDNGFINGEVEINTCLLEHSSPCIGYSFYIKRTPRFDVDSAIKNDVPKILWSKLQKNVSQMEYEGRVYHKHMVLGEERKGIKISYVTDSRPVATLPDFIEDSDLFICEGTYGDDADAFKAEKNKHMTFREAARTAKGGKVKKLLLTHFGTAMISPEEFLENASEEFLNTEIAYDRYKMELNFEDEN
ncbi:MAG: ribonuclease Z [Clostridium sp.]|nr:ribonuclease Z [Clostridium sp.]